ncbi:methyltransferase domain-containing protein [Phormidium sp. LEGE 05292]|uniref:class I SAM-dependent methyltransferase n=1 Tax=[Phormidium] sp. LEGE 05292 TaxID=767427 RepID=UPI00188280F3|nr:class I SAM-dependent methyltransferase [Phormidium sp. LEGE 05292]MBE9226811.1 methyltransferase domain-containing protein [Phormidium sp. LEGE 05292]
MTQTTINLQTAPGHQVLAAAGKKILRPGGKSATEQLFKWANFQPDETVLELASSFGYSAIALAQRFGVKVVGVEKNPASVARARANIQAAGLTDKITIIEGDIFHLEAISGQFDYVFAEAILSMQSAPGKVNILNGIYNKLKPGGKFLSHEMLANNRETEIHEELARVIRSNTSPLSQANWIASFANAGLEVKQHQTGSMALLNLRRMIQDEGLFSTAKILWNVVSNSQIRQRILAMHRIFQKYQQDLGYIVLVAQKN